MSNKSYAHIEISFTVDAGETAATEFACHLSHRFRDMVDEEYRQGSPKLGTYEGPLITGLIDCHVTANEIRE